MTALDLAVTARSLVEDGKGILAADESLPTIETRFKTIDVPSTAESRRDYRELLFSTPGLGDHVSGIILFDETIRQEASDGTPLPELIKSRGCIPGIKVDKGAKALAGFSGEKVTEGLDGLRDRLNEYSGLGARFTKWRAVITIGDGLPSSYCIRANAEALARFAALSQEAGLVPIVEPEVLMDGDHTIERCFEVVEATLHTVFHSLFLHGVVLEEMLLKPSMVLAGKTCPHQASVEDVACETVRCLLRTVPAAVPGIVFLSGGQSSEVATAHLNAMNALPGTRPWKLSFSYGRALQESPLTTWRGDAANVESAQKALQHRAMLNGAACGGTYTAKMEEAVPA